MNEQQKPYYKVYRPTGEIHELAGGTVNGWSEEAIQDAAD